MTQFSMKFEKPHKFIITSPAFEGHIRYWAPENFNVAYPGYDPPGVCVLGRPGELLRWNRPEAVPMLLETPKEKAPVVMDRMHLDTLRRLRREGRGEPVDGMGDDLVHSFACLEGFIIEPTRAKPGLTPEVDVTPPQRGRRKPRARSPDILARASITTLQVRCGAGARWALAPLSCGYAARVAGAGRALPVRNDPWASGYRRAWPRRSWSLR